MGDGKNTPEEYEIGATEVAPMINEALKTSSSVFMECNFLEKEVPFEEKTAKKCKVFLCRNMNAQPHLTN